MERVNHFTFILFGGTGDLALRKLIPALYNIYYENSEKSTFSLIGISRKEMSDEKYREYFVEGVKKFSRNPFDEAVFERLSSAFYYISGNLQEDGTYEKVLQKLAEVEGSEKNRLFYLATAPEHFPVLLENLSKHGILQKDAKNPWHRVMIEKPFGSDLESARSLNRRLEEYVTPEQLFRIDHYLGKEAVQNIITLRFGNGIFEPLWNNHHIDNIQITAAETLGVGSRGRYYEQSGATRDMFQNHILQILALIGMEAPLDLAPSSVAFEKLKVLKALQFSGTDYIVRGQYQGYTNENDVSPGSTVETFLAARLEIRNWRWAGVPIYVRTGKMLKEKRTQIVIQFKKIPYNLFSGQGIDSNKLMISIEPRTGIDLEFNVKEPNGAIKIKAVRMNFCHECEFGNNTPESYERLLRDASLGDASLFTSWEEVESSWEFVEETLKSSINTLPLLYLKGSWGPEASNRIVGIDGREWYNRFQNSERYCYRVNREN